MANNMTYYELLNSEYWKNLKLTHTSPSNKHFKTWVCWVCREHKQFYHLHHKNYDNIGNEKYGKDVVRICDTCHKLLHFEHGLKVAFDSLKLRQKAKRLRKLFLQQRKNSCKFV